jgi:hypothetical protein
MDRLDHGIRRRRQEATEQMRTWDRFCGSSRDSAAMAAWFVVIE